MSWRSISDLVREMSRKSQAIPEIPDVKQRAGILVLSMYGPQRFAAAPALINIAALTLSMTRLVVHRVSPGVSRTVHETDLHTLPGEPPRLLRRAWIVEVRKPGKEFLFGDTASLAGYVIDDDIFLIGVSYPDGVYVSRWRPKWEERDLDSTVERDTSPLIDDVEGHHDWALQAARYSVVLGLLLDAEGTPISTGDERPAKQKKRQRTAGSSSGKLDWITRRIYINERRFLSSSTQSDTLEGKSPQDGLVREEVIVRGHLRRQAYGPGRSLRKWVYVQAYEARRWVSPRPLRVEVVTKGRDNT